MKTIGFIGLGHMGQPMAHNLVKAGFTVYVFDLVKETVDEVVKAGAFAACSVAEMADKADIVITMVQTGDQVKKICLGDNGLFSHLKSHTLYIDCSSIDISVTRELHKHTKEAGIEMLDAPVSGGVAGAEAGSLTMMVGGEIKAFEHAQSVLNALGKKVIHAGAAGSGQAAKICNNLLLGISMIGVCEAFNLAEKLGLDAGKFFEISSNASGQCWSMTSYCPVPGILENVPSNHDYEPGFTANMMLKDLHLGEGAAKTAHASIPLGHAAADLYEKFVQAGQGEKDFSGVIEFIKSQ